MVTLFSVLSVWWLSRLLLTGPRRHNGILKPVRDSMCSQVRLRRQPPSYSWFTSQLHPWLFSSSISISSRWNISVFCELCSSSPLNHTSGFSTSSSVSLPLSIANSGSIFPWYTLSPCDGIIVRIHFFSLLFFPSFVISPCLSSAGIVIPQRPDQSFPVVPSSPTKML